MSLDELRADLATNIKDARTVLDDRTRQHLEHTLWPFLEALVEVVDEMDDAVAELVDQQEDYLQPETAAVFAAVIQSSLQLAAELRNRSGGDESVVAAITQHEQLCEAAIAVLGDVTLVATDEDEDEEGDEDGNEAEPAVKEGAQP